MSPEAEQVLLREQFDWDDATQELIDLDLVEYNEDFDGEEEWSWWTVTEAGRKVQDTLRLRPADQ